MEKISIETLYPETKTKKFGEIDVRSICNTYNNARDYRSPLDIRPREVKFSIDDIIRKKQEKKIKKNNMYIVVLNGCYEEINNANALDKTDIIYDAKYDITFDPDFCIDECMQKVEKKLRDDNIRTRRLSRTRLFVSWYHLVN